MGHNATCLDQNGLRLSLKLIFYLNWTPWVKSESNQTKSGYSWTQSDQIWVQLNPIRSNLGSIEPNQDQIWVQSDPIRLVWAQFSPIRPNLVQTQPDQICNKRKKNLIGIKAKSSLKQLTFQLNTLKILEQNTEHRNQPIKSFKIKFVRTEHETPNRTSQKLPRVAQETALATAQHVGPIIGLFCSRCQKRQNLAAINRERQIEIEQRRSHAHKPTVADWRVPKTGRPRRKFSFWRGDVAQSRPFVLFLF